MPVIRYATLFNVRITHAFFENMDRAPFDLLTAEQRRIIGRQRAVAAFIAIAPASETRRLLNDQRMVFKARADGFRVGVEINAAGEPFVPISGDLNLRFALRPSDPRLASYTSPEVVGRTFLRLGNDSGNVIATRPFLTQPVAPFSATTAYSAGDIRTVAQGATFQLHQAIRDTGPSAAPDAADWTRLFDDTHDPARVYAAGDRASSGNQVFEALVNAPGAIGGADWQLMDTLANQFATRRDAMALHPALFRLDVSAAASASVTVNLRRPGIATIVHTDRAAVDTGNVLEALVDARSIPPGRYEIEVLDAASASVAALASTVYIDGDAVNCNWLGVIEIGAGINEFALLTAGGAVRDPAAMFELAFLNRSSRWRYRFSRAQPIGAGADVAAEGATGTVLLSTEVWPHTRSSQGIRLRADDPATPAPEDIALPSPSTSTVRREAGQWVSEQFLTNFPVF